LKRAASLILELLAPRSASWFFQHNDARSFKMELPKQASGSSILELLEAPFWSFSEELLGR
jgi:hypothetical protein